MNLEAVNPITNVIDPEDFMDRPRFTVIQGAPTPEPDKEELIKRIIEGEMVEFDPVNRFKKVNFEDVFNEIEHEDLMTATQLLLKGQVDLAVELLKEVFEKLAEVQLNDAESH